MPNVAAFNSDNPANLYMEGEVNLGMIWNGSAFVARRAVRQLMVWPKEGGIFWMDSRRSGKCQNKEGALKLINFLLRPDVQNRLLKLSVIQRQTLRRVSC